MEQVLEGAQTTFSSKVRTNRQLQTQQQDKINELIRKTGQAEEEIKIKKENRSLEMLLIRHLNREYKIQIFSD